VLASSFISAPRCEAFFGQRAGALAEERLTPRS